MTTHIGRRTAAALWNARDGIAALEFALVAPVLILLVAGAVSFGVGLRMQMEVGEAARAGAAYAVAHVFDATAITTAAQSATALATSVKVAAAQTQNLSCMNSATGAITDAGTGSCSSGGPAGNYVTVTTTMPYSFILSPTGTAQQTTLSGKSVVRIN